MAEDTIAIAERMQREQAAREARVRAANERLKERPVPDLRVREESVLVQFRIPARWLPALRELAADTKRVQSSLLREGTARLLRAWGLEDGANVGVGR